MCIFIILTIEIGTFELKLFLGNFLQLWHRARELGQVCGATFHDMGRSELQAENDLFAVYWCVICNCQMIYGAVLQTNSYQLNQLGWRGAGQSESLRESQSQASVTVTRYELVLCSQGVIIGLIRDRDVTQHTLSILITTTFTLSLAIIISHTPRLNISLIPTTGTRTRRILMLYIKLNSFMKTDVEINSWG